jgi:hypothetical protein
VIAPPRELMHARSHPKDGYFVGPKGLVDTR